MQTLLTIKQFAAKHPAFTESSMRHLIFYAETTGFHVCVRRIGRRVYILESEFFAWVEQKNACPQHIRNRSSVLYTKGQIHA